MNVYEHDDDQEKNSRFIAKCYIFPCGLKAILFHTHPRYIFFRTSCSASHRKSLETFLFKLELLTLLPLSEKRHFHWRDKEFSHFHKYTRTHTHTGPLKSIQMCQITLSSHMVPKVQCVYMYK